MEVLDELPLVPGVSSAGDEGVPYMLLRGEERGRVEVEAGGRQWRDCMDRVAARVWEKLN